MKKFIALLLALLTVCACSTALAAPVGYESEKNYMCEDFEDADNTMIGKEDSPVAKAFDKHDMDPYYFADGTMEITNDGENGSKGLKLIPDYYSDLQNGSDVILRTQLQRVCATLDESKREEVRKAWGEATGFSFYVRNETGSNVLCVPGLFLQLGEDRTLALGAGLDTVLMEKDGTVIDTEFTNGWSNTSVIIPVDFEGWLIQKNILGKHDDWDTCWGAQPWEDESKIDDPEAKFENAAFFQVDFRLNVSGLDDTGYIVVDSFELLTQSQSDATPAPENSGTPAETASAAADNTAAPQNPSKGLGTPVIIIIAVAAAAVIAVVVIVVVRKLKNKADK